MNKKEFKQTRDQIVKGMIISAEKLLIKKKLLGQKLVISENGIIRIIDPLDLK